MAEIVSAPIYSQGFEYGVKHFSNPKSGLLSEILQDLLQLDLITTQSLIQLGAVYVNNKRCLMDELIAEGQLLRVHTKPRRHCTDYSWNDFIVHEDSNFLVLNKPSGIPSHAAVDNIIDNSLHQLELSGSRKLMITHRLDTLTEGLIVYGKTKYFVTSFNKLIQNRQIQKKYVAQVETTSVLPKKLIHYMETSLRAPKKVTAFFQENTALCELDIEKQIIGSEFSWIKINLHTGRTHQIRAQTSAMLAPICGDYLYGAKTDWNKNGIALKACEIGFTWNDKTYEFKLAEDLLKD